MSKLKKILISIPIILIVLVALGYFALSGKEYTIQLEQKDIQAALDKHLPYEKEYLYIFKLSVDDVEVKLKEGSDKIGSNVDLSINARVNDMPDNLGASIASESNLRYQQDNACFYLINPEIQDLKVNGVPEKYTTKISDFSRSLMTEYVTEVPVYQIQDDSIKKKLAKALLKDIRVVDGKLEIVLEL